MTDENRFTAKPSDKAHGVGVYSAPSYNLYNDSNKKDGADPQSLLQAVCAVAEQPEMGRLQGCSNLGFNTGGLFVHQRPLCSDTILRLKDISTHHSACISSKKNCTTGLGFFGSDEIDCDASEKEDASMADIVNILLGNCKVNSKVDEQLDPLCTKDFMNILQKATEDYFDAGNGFLEVVRNSEGDITYLGHIPECLIEIVEDRQHRKIFYQYRGSVAGESGYTYYMPMFGKANKDWMFGEEGPYANSDIDPTTVSEVIHFEKPTNRVQFYGYPDWLAAVADIDLVKKAKQYKADFYHNRGVLDFVMVVEGGSLSDDQYASLENMARSAAGDGNRFVTGVVHLADEKATFKVEKLAGDMKTEEQFGTDMEVLAQNIVSAHRVPPILANILIPGKLGATNEAITALVTFQLLVIGPEQQIFQSTLASTLGDPDETGLDLDENDFRLRTITSQLNITGMSTVARSRTEALDGNENSDRNFDDGVKD